MIWPPDDFVGYVERDGDIRPADPKTCDARDESWLWCHVGSEPAPESIPATVGVCFRCEWCLGVDGRLVRSPDLDDLVTGRAYMAECGLCGTGLGY